MDNSFTNEIAIKELMSLMMKDDQKVCSDNTIFAAIKALSFRIPKRPITLPDRFICSNCNGTVSIEQDFCPHCGLAINWDEN